MMKLAALVWLLAVPGHMAWSATEVIETPIVAHSAPVAVSVSSSVYTNVTSAATRIADLTAILVDNPSTNTATMHGHVGNCISTSISTSTVTGPIELAPGANGGVIGLAEDQCIWLVTRNTTSAENVMVQGVSQRR